MKTVFLCEGEFESILCGVYDAWISRLGHANVKLELVSNVNYEMFCQYHEVETTPDKVKKVSEAIHKKISGEAYEMVYKASLSKDENRADKIYRFLIYGFHHGRNILTMLQIAAVFNLFKMCRYVSNEQHVLLGFVRFAQMKQGILLGSICPKNDVLVLLAPHFSERLSGENWILYDEGREKAVLHSADNGWIVVRLDSEQWKEQFSHQTDEEEFQELWKSFHRSISIKERENPVCQRTHLPVRYRSYMTEFQGGNEDSHTL